MQREVFTEEGFDGKQRKFVYNDKGYYSKIYKQYKRSKDLWEVRLRTLLTNAKYSMYEIQRIVEHCYNRGYFINSNYYVPPQSIVQRINELGYVNLEVL